MMVDIHTHVIPNVDDGSRDIETSLEMLKEAVANGVTTLFATPHHYYKHYEASVSTIRENFELLKAKAKENNIPIELKLGMEIYYTSREDIISMLKNDELLTMDGSKTVLIEFDLIREPREVEETLYRFKLNGYNVIIAHVERYAWISLDLIQSMRLEGAKIQINSTSILGKEGFKKKWFVKKLLRKGLVDYIASDMHSFRRGNLSKAKDIVKTNKYFEY